MGSGSSKHVAATSTETKCFKRSHSGCCHRSSMSPENTLEVASNGHISNICADDKPVNISRRKSFSRKLKSLTRSSTTLSEKKHKSFHRSVSEVHRISSEAPSIETQESSIRNSSSTEKDESTSQSLGDTTSSSAGSSRGNTNNRIQRSNSTRSSRGSSSSRLRRVRSFNSSEVYSFFARRLRRQLSSDQRHERSEIDSLSRGSNSREVQDNSQHNIDGVIPRIQGDCLEQEAGLSFPSVNALAYDSVVSNEQPSNSERSDTVNITQPSTSGQSSSSLQNNSQALSLAPGIPRYSRRRGTNEHTDENMNFRRNHSVGRLRDRVLRSMTSSEGPPGNSLEEPLARESRQNERRIWDTLTGGTSSIHDERVPAFADHHFLNTLRSLNEDSQNRSQTNEALPGNASNVQNRNSYLEDRRRRARYQVRALQRLSNSFENLAGHERSCVLAGHHRTGRCSCQTASRSENTQSRANISRIIMLAEALFEVLDEIHQQSVALSSRSPVSSLGSQPAPAEIVNSMPVRAYSKQKKDISEDDDQCYICLVECVEGDPMRMLPCSHEFHLQCIDKWLKEIHRVCPLCRGNVCDNSQKTNPGTS